MTEDESLELVHFAGLASGGTVSGTIISGARQGKRVFAFGAVPGEDGLVSITREAERFCEGELVEVTTPSPHRVIPPCPLFSTCGGCDYQQIDPQTQRALKVSMVESMLRFQGRIEPVHGVSLLGENLPHLHYRRRATLHLSRDGALGFFRRGTGNVVDCHHCLILEKPLNDLLVELRPYLPTLAPAVMAISFERGESAGGSSQESDSERDARTWLILKLREGCDRQVLEHAAQSILASPIGHRCAIGFSEKERLYAAFRNGRRLKDDEVATAPGRFSQGNSEGNKLLVQTVVDRCRDLFEVTEFYAGSGNFTFPLAAAGRVVTAIEVDPDLVAAGEARAQSRSVSHQVRFLRGSAEWYIKHHQVRGGVLLDPPRSGARAVVQALRPELVSSIVYVSCNVPTLCRDLGTLVKSGFVVEEVSVIDLFPQTHHGELVAVVKPRASSRRE